MLNNKKRDISAIKLEHHIHKPIKLTVQGIFIYTYYICTKKFNNNLEKKKKLFGQHLGKHLKCIKFLLKKKHGRLVQRSGIKNIKKDDLQKKYYKKK